MFGSHQIPLENVKVATPCPADWDGMFGNDRVRFCSECKMNVYNLSGMRRVDAERLVSSVEGRLCVRYYKRADGTVLTRDCPIGLAAVRPRAVRLATAVAGLVIGLFTGSAATMAFGTTASKPIGPSGREVMGSIAATPQPVRNEPEMGDCIVVQGRIRSRDDGNGLRDVPVKKRQTPRR